MGRRAAGMSTSTFKVDFRADPAPTEAMVETLSNPDGIASGVVSWSEDADGTCRISVYFTDRPDLAALRALLQEAVGAGAPLPRLKLEELPPRDWAREVQRDLHPVRAGRFLVHGSHDRDRARGRPCAIEIDAGQAFGTAHHGTTRGCLLALDDLLKRRRFRRVLDIGTGTGILAIAAAKARRGPVVACDVDPVAVAIARENACRNEDSRFVKVVRATDTGHPAVRQEAPFDLILANILARPLTRLAPGIAAASAKHGALVLSGITLDQQAGLTARYGDAGFVLLRRLILEDWVTLVLGRRR